MTDISTLITTIGFPIVACIALFWYMSQKMDTLTSAITALTTEVAKMANMFDIEVNYLGDQTENEK